MGLVETTLGDGDRTGVVTVTLADEENRNALSAALVAELVAALDAGADDNVCALVVYLNRHP